MESDMGNVFEVLVTCKTIRNDDGDASIEIRIPTDTTGEDEAIPAGVVS
jgi:hypothetical protein